MNEFAGFPFHYKEIIEVIKKAGAYLVGGAVRDRLLNTAIRDLDFALQGEVTSYAKEVADRLNGYYYLLDKDRGAARVILQDPKQGRLIVDFTCFQGETIEDDLQSRDFTITSMAMNINQDHQLIDPFRGAQDLRDGILRSTSDHSIKDDPLRCVRAVRMAAQLGLHIVPETKKQIREYKDYLSEISPERIRDEVFRILDGPYQSAAMQSLQVLGIYSMIFFTDLTDVQISVLRKLTDLWNLLQKNHDQETATNWAFGLVSHRLGRYREQLQAHLRHEPVPGRSVYQLSFLLPLMLPEERETAELENGVVTQILTYLALSNQERYQAEKAIQSALQFGHLTRNTKELTPIDAFCFFRDYGPAGIEGIFVGLAWFLASEGQSLQKEGWLEMLDSARFLLEAWWEKHAEWISPPLLLNGDDLQRELKLDPGPKIGILLEKLKEAQVEEGINTKEKALEYLRSWLVSVGFEDK